MREFDFLGNGLSFPVESDGATGRFRESSEEEDIRQAIQIILSTQKGERVMRPEFGCDIFNYAFGTLDYTSLRMMEQAVRDALIRWEPRIRNLEVRAGLCGENAGIVEFGISYVVRSTNNRYNMVYPFFVSEGTGGI